MMALYEGAPASSRDARPPAFHAQAVELEPVLRAMAHPLRLEILELVARGPARVGAIARELGAGQAAVSQQLRILRLAGLVQPARRDGVLRYALVSESLRTLDRAVHQWSRRPRPASRAGSRSGRHRVGLSTV